ncbi:DUF3530 family protein [Zooshikella harenae]|uniref:DUF3530 family protein n=1 Tax=Zooshikella harenae TaxID=2827238 RepID=A0ABS5Z9G2_9GAMM|nr:DUF3530 family protein [Zooshikella harenae]MBU2710533.1 DUF3530 family protein [Zooshikella harenae]
MRHIDLFITCIIILLSGRILLWAAQEDNSTNSPAAPTQPSNSGQQAPSPTDSANATMQENTTTPQQDRALANDFINRSQQALQQIYASDQLVTLNLPKDTIYGLWQNERAGSLKGAVILLAEQGNHADWPKYMHKLRQQLPLKGWSTLAINPPSPSKVIMEARKASSSDSDKANAIDADTKQKNKKLDNKTNANPTSNKTDNEKQQTSPNNNQPKTNTKENSAPKNQETDSEKHLPVFKVTPSLQEKYASSVNELMKSAHKFGQEKTTDKVFLLAIGNSCPFLLPHLTNHPDDYTGIILIDCKPNNWSPASMPVEPLDKLKIPVLDLEVNSAPLYSRWAQLRKAASIKAENPSYRQRLLISMSYDSTLDSRILKYVGQWVDAVLDAIKRAEKAAEEAAKLQ